MKLADAVAAHDRALAFGGLPGVRDRGSIEAAIARPYSGYYRSIARKAAALTHSLALNHGFIDGNKRTALYVVNLFLRKSGYRLRHKSQAVRNHEIEQMIADVVERRMSLNSSAGFTSGSSGSSA
ncbi:MAG: type II toxin-antitoxin system death-on-curing family toxin [Alphaproteobacteria bacterium]|nr:type II toxin-antitoxin system death-on-curing family toxin [Alphaproteobacteria bacterium]